MLSLRPAVPADGDLYFEIQQDPQAVWMAAFVSKDLTNRAAFDARWARMLADDPLMLRMVCLDGEPIGLALKYVDDGTPEVSYWLDRRHWGHGYATEALRLLLREVAERPIRARAAQDNAASLAVLRHNGFVVTGEGVGVAEARGGLLAEYVLTLAG